MEKRKVNVKISGQVYTVISNKPDDYFERLSTFLERRVKNIGKACPSFSTTKVAMLAALDIADEYLTLLEEQAVKQEEPRQMETPQQLHPVELGGIKRDETFSRENKR